jgi:hypothetical protein
MLLITDAKAAALTGTGTTGGILVLNLVSSIMPTISMIGIICGCILAVHGVIELIIHHYRYFKKINKKGP